MKKIISVTLASALCLGLCACQSDNKYEDLERRVSAIEDQLNIDSSEVVQTSNNNIESSEISESIESNHVYDLSGMSAEEMLNLFISFADVHTGDMITDYPSRFDVEPENISNTSYQFTSYNEQNSQIITNCIRNIYANVQVEMDNSITIKESSFINIEFILDDYDLASTIYDIAYNYAISNWNEEIWMSDDYREGTNWNSYVNYNMFSMNKNDDNYEIIIMIPISNYIDNEITETSTNEGVNVVQEQAGEIMP